MSDNVQSPDNPTRIQKGLPENPESDTVRTILSKDCTPPGHPITRCPEEILVMIFLWTALSDPGDWDLVAKNISHVSREWRYIALRTSLLWADIDLSLRRSISSLEEYLERTMPRIRSTPVNVTIRDIGRRRIKDSATTAEFMERFHINRFYHITYMCLLIFNPHGLNLITNPAFGYSAGPLDLLFIDTQLFFNSIMAYDPSGILYQFPTVKAVRFLGSGVYRIGDGHSFPSITILGFKYASIPNLATQLHQFTNLQELYVEGKGFKFERVAGDISLPQLTVLVIMKALQFPWGAITAPMLRQLSTDDDTEDANTFVCQQTSLHRLQYCIWVKEDNLQRLAAGLPSLELLEIAGEIGCLFKDTTITSTLFPKLKHLRIEVDEAHGISLHEFEYLVNTRCLRYEASRTARLDIVEIVGRPGALAEGSWRSSPLLTHFRETTKVWTGNHALQKLCLELIVPR